MLEKPRYSPVIQLGQIVQAVTFAGTIAGAAWIVSARQTTNENDIKYAKDAISEIKSQNADTLQTLNTLATSIARIEGRLNPTAQ